LIPKARELSGGGSATTVDYLGPSDLRPSRNGTEREPDDATQEGAGGLSRQPARACLRADGVSDGVDVWPQQHGRFLPCRASAVWTAVSDNAACPVPPKKRSREKAELPRRRRSGERGSG
ncbi:unnamed protein product, partial [Scytosiphon promiscuus]